MADPCVMLVLLDACRVRNPFLVYNGSSAGHETSLVPPSILRYMDQ